MKTSKYKRVLQVFFLLYIFLAVSMSLVGVNQYLHNKIGIEGLLFGFVYTFLISIIIYIFFRKYTKGVTEPKVKKWNDDLK